MRSMCDVSRIQPHLLDRCRQWLAVVLFGLAILLSACAPDTSLPPTPTKTPVPTMTPIPPTQTPLPTIVIPTATITPAEPTTQGEDITATPQEESAPDDATSTPPTTTSTLLNDDHYWLRRPVEPDAERNYLDRTYPYGSTAGGKYRPHTGVEFFNPAGTPVVAVAGAVVHYAGTDTDIIFGPQPGFYGNLIILQLSGLAYNGLPVYVFYGHLSEIGVEQGQQVANGEVIGEVGGTGVANGGAHLHFEVRVGDPMGYTTATRNPDLWIKPYYGYGTLAGRIIDSQGSPLSEVSIIIRGDDTVRYGWTYAGTENIPDDVYGENFTYGDLPEGWYTVSTSSASGKLYREEIYIQSGRTTWLEFTFDQ